VPDHLSDAEILKEITGTGLRHQRNLFGQTLLDRDAIRLNRVTV